MNNKIKDRANISGVLGVLLRQGKSHVLLSHGEAG